MASIFCRVSSVCAASASSQSLYANSRSLSTSSRLYAASNGSSHDDNKPLLSKAESDNDREFDSVTTRKIDYNAPVDTDYLSRKDWVSHGFSYVDEDEDVITFHIWMFAIWTLFFGGMGWALAYRPTAQHIDWVSREAALELRRRERLGLPLVNMDLIPRERIVLPTEEELGDFLVHI